MKKLRIALTLLFALSCTLFLFACGGGEKVVKRIDSMTGQKTSFREMEDFSVGDLKVVVVYEGSDEKVTLTSEQYKIDSSAYKKDQAGEYTIKVIPTEQKVEEGEEEYYETYSVTVEHDFQKQADGTEKCSGCGATRESRTGLTSQIATVGWGNQATYTPGENPYPNAKAPIPGENHVAFDVLVKGQALTLTLRIDEVDTGATWNTPLMGFRNGADGALPREDKWVIGTAAGYTTPDHADGQTATTGDAGADTANWVFFCTGDTWEAGDMAPKDGKFATDIIAYDYTLDGIMKIRHTFTSADGSINRTIIYSAKVPDAAYEIAAYGEKVTYTVTETAFTANRTVSKFEASAPTNKTQAEGKMFDTTGIKAVATFSDNDTFEGQYNAYAYIDVAREIENEGENGEKIKTTVYDKTRVNISTEPLQAGMYDFNVEFGGKTVWFTKDGKETPVTDNTQPLGENGGTENSLITVIPTQVSGGIASVVVSGDVAFESAVTVDYQLNAAGDGIDLVVKGVATKALAAQKSHIGNKDYYVAFNLLGSSAAFDGASISDAQGKVEVYNGENGLKNVHVIAGIDKDAKSFTITLTKTDGTVASGEMKVNLDVEYPAVTVEQSNSFTLDKGGDYTVVYDGFAASELSDATKVTLTGSGQSATLDKAKDGVDLIGSNFRIKSAKVEGTKLTVVYTIGAPNLSNLTSDNAKVVVSVKTASTTVETTLYYNFAFSSEAIELENDVYVISSGSKLLLAKAFSKENDVRDGLSFTAMLNIQNDNAISYDLGVTLKNGVVAFTTDNVVTTGKASEGKVITFGAVNNNNDYDRGALLIASLDLQALNIRTGTGKVNREKPYFFAQEPNAEQDKYTIYKVEADTIKKIEATHTGDRITTQQGSCVLDGITAYEYKDGDLTFLYGTIVTPATGEHDWQTKEGGKDECSKCHWTREKVTTENGYNYIILGTETDNKDEAGDWWTVGVGITKVHGNFAVEYTFENTDESGDYSDPRLQIFDANAKYITIDLLCTGDVVVDASLLSEGKDAVIVTQKLTKDGTEVDKANWFTHGTGAGELKGETVALITRVGNTLEIKTTWTAPSKSVYVNNIVITNIVASDFTVQIGGYTLAVNNLKIKSGNVEVVTVYTNEVWKYGVEGANKVLWTDWFELPVLTLGSKITVTGSYQGGDLVHQSGLWEIKTAMTGRVDNYCWSFDKALFGVTATEQDKMSYGTPVFEPELGDKDFVQTLIEINKDCNFTYTFSWETASQVVVTIALEGKNGTNYTCTYKLPLVQAAPEGGFEIHLAAEATTITFNTVTVS